MVNPWASEVALVIGGKEYTLKLTLGALAELEARLEADSLVDLVKRFEQNKVSSGDILHLIVAGLRGGGWRGTAEDLLSTDIKGGLIEASEAAAELLVRAFMLCPRQEK